MTYFSLIPLLIKILPLWTVYDGVGSLVSVVVVTIQYNYNIQKLYYATLTVKYNKRRVFVYSSY